MTPGSRSAPEPPKITVTVRHDPYLPTLADRLGYCPHRWAWLAAGGVECVICGEVRR